MSFRGVILFTLIVVSVSLFNVSLSSQAQDNPNPIPPQTTIISIKGSITYVGYNGEVIKASSDFSGRNIYDVGSVTRANPSPFPSKFAGGSFISLGGDTRFYGDSYSHLLILTSHQICSRIQSFQKYRYGVAIGTSLFNPWRCVISPTRYVYAAQISVWSDCLIVSPNVSTARDISLIGAHRFTETLTGVLTRFTSGLNNPYGCFGE